MQFVALPPMPMRSATWISNLLSAFRRTKRGNAQQASHAGILMKHDHSAPARHLMYFGRCVPLFQAMTGTAMAIYTPSTSGRMSSGISLLEWVVDRTRDVARLRLERAVVLETFLKCLDQWPSRAGIWACGSGADIVLGSRRPACLVRAQWLSKYPDWKTAGACSGTSHQNINTGHGEDTAGTFPRSAPDTVPIAHTGRLILNASRAARWTDVLLIRRVQWCFDLERRICGTSHRGRSLRRRPDSAANLLAPGVDGITPE